ncbi:DUF192 domain-containing protein [Streptomyces halstedii]|uniref:DUF192 domain-containing protein n=1 Tax=Streptomyces halstedii TaxID=1944 RepID=A0ABS6TQZ4_STRHA|nr:DUF192 domain-containing protein [Streptomyces halstedii]MBV7670697.1 DUF192 domain-containing protein [Streptomyces halstedii]
MGRWRDGRGTLTVGTDTSTVTEAGVDERAAGNAGPEPDGRASGARSHAIPLRIAASYRARARGLLGSDGVDGALLITPCAGVHTFRMRFTIDVAYLDRDFRVLAVRTMKPGRLGLPRPWARHVLESEGGAMEGWGLRPGRRVRISPAPPRSLPPR